MGAARGTSRSDNSLLSVSDTRIVYITYMCVYVYKISNIPIISEAYIH